MTESIIKTARLSLMVATPEELDKVIDADHVGFAEATGAEPPDPFLAPPETGDVLEFFRDTLLADPTIGPWFFRWVIDHQIGKLVGSAGFGDHPDADGVVLIGYSVYPEFEGQGYATEAAQALVQWAMQDERVAAVRATILPGNTGSRRVAEKAGLTFQRCVETDEDGLVELWEIRRLSTA
jgi:RimJ/RimL family protein N-acetyltransferase